MYTARCTELMLPFIVFFTLMYKLLYFCLKQMIIYKPGIDYEDKIEFPMSQRPPNKPKQIYKILSHYGRGEKMWRKRGKKDRKKKRKKMTLNAE